MVQRLPRFSPKILVLAVLLVAARDGDAQQSVPTSPTPTADVPGTKVSPPTDAATAPQKLSKQEPDAKLVAKIEAIFGIKDLFGEDTSTVSRPVRLWLSQVNMAVAAKEVALGHDGRTVRFLDVNLGLPAEKTFLRGGEGIMMVDEQIKAIDQLSTRNVLSVKLQNQNGTIVLTRKTFEGSLPPRTLPAPPAPPALETSMAEETKNEMIMNERRLTLARRMAQVIPSFDIRFNFNLDAQAPLADFLPAAAKMMSKAPLPFNEDLTMVAEIGLGEPMAKDTDKHQTTELIAHAIAKINHLNAKKHDGFMLAMIEHRADLRGLPFLMGDDCRSNEQQARTFAAIAPLVHRMNASPPKANLIEFEKFIPAKLAIQGKSEVFPRAVVAALMQIVMPAPEQTRISLAKYLATIPHVDATKALAGLAIYSAEDAVCSAAIDGLKQRSDHDYTDVLMQGFNYPLPAVAKRWAEALVKLNRKDVLADLIDVLERPDPRLPVAEKRDGKDVTTVRELVKVNHHRNCLLCHAPGNTENIPTGVLKVAMPSPVEPLPKPTAGGGYQTTPASPDILVRIDMTYLRQDFSLMMPVADAQPWPELQRFDFLVRTRPVTPSEVQAFESRREPVEPGRPSVYHRAALFALRELSGRDAEATPQAWRKVLNIAKRS